MIPIVNGRVHHFMYRGLYDGVSLLGDRETGSLWHHVSGLALHGPLEGTRLESGTIFHMTAQQALAAYPDIALALSERPMTDRPGRWWPWVERIPVLSQTMRNTLGGEDTRRPTMDVGLGIWTDRVQRYYPLEVISSNDGVIVDRLDQRRIAIVHVPGWAAPMAWYVEATSARWDGDILRFNTGATIRSGVLYSASGQRVQADRPRQLFTRWYGYALMFPDTDIYGERNR